MNWLRFNKRAIRKLGSPISDGLSTTSYISWQLLQTRFQVNGHCLPLGVQHAGELDLLALPVALLHVTMEEDVPLACLWTLDEAIVFLVAKALDSAKELSEFTTRFVNFESS